MSDRLPELRSAACLIGNLPEDPGYNGQRLIIDDVESKACESVMDWASNEIATLRAELEKVTKERDEARKKAAIYRADFETAAATADKFQKERDAALAKLEEARGALLIGWEWRRNDHRRRI